jgi:hypothetical protein
MNSLKPFLFILTIDAIFAFLFVQGAIYGNEGAANIFLFFTWLYALAMWIVAGILMQVKPSAQPVETSRWRSLWDDISVFIHISFVVAMVWLGWIVLPTVYFIGFMLLMVAKKSAKKVLEQAKPTEETEHP